MNKKGQGALEYLFLIGGVAVVILVIAVILFSLEGDTEKQANETFDDFNDVIGGLNPVARVNLNLEKALFGEDEAAVSERT